MKSSRIKYELARSLSAESTDILPCLPYLLQDFWSLGINPEIVLELLRRNLKTEPGVRVLDLACGKGAVSVFLAKKLNLHITGIDLIDEFIHYARAKACEYEVAPMCYFSVDDANEYVKYKWNYHCAIFSGAGPILGGIEETLRKLKGVIKYGGIVIIDNYDYIDKNEADIIFNQAGLELIDKTDESEINGSDICSYELIGNAGRGMTAIINRARELSEAYPAQYLIFEKYIQSQRNEYMFIENQNPADRDVWCLRNI